VTFVVLEVLWDCMSDDLRALITFSVMHGDLVPGNHDFHKFNVICGDAACWAMFYYFRVYIRWAERMKCPELKEEWTWPSGTKLPTKPNT